jgi:DNA-binding NtrC family response regulator
MAQNAHGVAHLIGSSPALRRLRDQLRGLGDLPFPVLFTGEPGSGRRQAARVLHAASAAAAAPLLELDARDPAPRDGLPVRGAVILVGIERLPADAQSYWARVARGRALGPRLLATAPASFAARASTNDFDPELLAALLRFGVHVPPLRQRRGDIAELAHHFAAETARELGRPEQRLTDAAVGVLREAHWFGNVAELRRVIERTLAFSAGGEVGADEIGAVLGEVRPSVDALRERRRVEERETLLQALADHGGNIARAAQALGRSRAALYRLAEKHGIALQRQRVVSGQG